MMSTFTRKPLSLHHEITDSTRHFMGANNVNAGLIQRQLAMRFMSMTVPMQALRLAHNRGMLSADQENGYQLGVRSVQEHVCEGYNSATIWTVPDRNGRSEVIEIITSVPAVSHRQPGDVVASAFTHNL